MKTSLICFNDWNILKFKYEYWVENALRKKFNLNFLWVQEVLESSWTHETTWSFHSTDRIHKFK